MKDKKNIHEYKLINFFAILYMTIMTLSAILGNKLIATPYGVLAGASLVSPFWFVLGDIITEVYGYKNVMKLFWFVIICQFIFSFACWFLIKLPSPTYWNGNSSYELVCGHLLTIAIFQFIGITIAWNLNARLLNKWKFLWKGKYFWLRSIGSSGIGMILFSITSVFPTVYSLYPLNEVVSIVAWSCVLKIVFTILLSGPSNFVVIILKAYEGIDEFHHNINENPFLNEPLLTLNP